MSPDTVVSRASLSATEFIESVLRLRPRVAVFDADGTLWAPDSGEQFFYWEMQRRVVPDEIARWAIPRYADYQAGRVGESEMCGEMVAIHAGMRSDELQRLAGEFFREHIEAKVFPTMVELARRLRESGCELWAVSSTNEWVVKAGMHRFGIADGHVLAAAAATENGVVTGRLLRVPTDADKAVVLRQALTDAPDAAFGNSLHDLAMLEMAKQAFVVNPNPDLESLARARGWPIYHPGP